MPVPEEYIAFKATLLKRSARIFAKPSNSFSERIGNWPRNPSLGQAVTRESFELVGP
jgi:hypothetical protein